MKTKVSEIGDPFFSVDIEENQNCYYPALVDIWDCEYETCITISTGEDNCVKEAEALVRILNERAIEDKNEN